MQSIRSFAESTMETLTYLHLAVHYEASDTTAMTARWKSSRILLTRMLYRNSLVLFSFILILGIGGWENPGFAGVKLGDRSSQVQTLQERLQALGYFEGTPTGYFGPVTREGIIKFQHANGLTPDGIVGTKTQSALTSCHGLKTIPESFSPRTIAPIFPVSTTIQRENSPIAQAQTPSSISDRLEFGSSGEEVEALQQRLDLLGYYQGEITGKFGEMTQAAVIAFQQDRRLVADGVVGSQTRRALQNPLPRNQIIALQQRLQKAGFYQGAIDGVWGPVTQRAIEAAQNTYGIRVSDLLR